MPVYAYQCTICEHVSEAQRRMAERDDCPACERCNCETVRHVAPSRVNVSAFQPLAMSSIGVPEHVMARAFRDERGNYVVNEGGRLRQLNLPGETLTDKGDVYVRNEGEYKRALREHGDPGQPLIPLAELGGRKGVRAENEKRKNRDSHKVERAMKRMRAGAEAAKRQGRRTGWIPKP